MLRLTPEQFERVCRVNPDAVLELAADGQLIPLTHEHVLAFRPYAPIQWWIWPAPP